MRFPAFSPFFRRWLLLGLLALFAAAFALVLTTGPGPAEAQSSAPSITAITISSTPNHDADGDGTPDTYMRGDLIQMTVTWNQDVYWDKSAANAAITTRAQVGSADRDFSLVGLGTSGAGPSLTFTYTVVEADVDPSGVALRHVNNAVVFLASGATLKDLTNNNAGLTFAGLPRTSQANHKVNGANNLPVFSGAGATINAPSGTLVSLPISVSDPDGDTLTISRTWSRDDIHVPGDREWSKTLGRQFFKAKTQCRLAQLTPLPTSPRHHTVVTFTATDPHGATVEAKLTYETTFSSTQCTNNFPTVANAIPDQSATAGSAFSYQFPANTFNDADSGDTLTYTATQADDSALPSWLTFTPSTRTFSGTPQPTDTGTLSVKVTADDSKNSVSDTFDITVSVSDVLVSNIGQSATPYQGGVLTSAHAQEFTTGTDPATLTSVDVKFQHGPDSNLRVRVRQGSPTGTVVATLTNPTTLAAADLTFTAPANTTLSASTKYYVVLSTTTGGGTLSLTLSDGEDTGGQTGWSIANKTHTHQVGIWRQPSENALQIRVNGSVTRTPTVANEIPDQSAKVGVPFSYAFPSNTFTDADGDTLTYTATQADDSALPSWLTFTPSTRTFSGTPQPTDAATLSVKVTASDSTNSVSDTFDIMVAEPVLVSNIGQSATPYQGGVLTSAHAQEFTTGTDPATLTSVDVKFQHGPDSNLRVRVRQGSPTGTVVATLTNPTTLAAADLTFTAPANTTLSASTKYYVVLSTTTGGGTLSLTLSDGEDTGGQTGWSIANKTHTHQVGIWRQPSENALQIRVNGSVTRTPTVTAAAVAATDGKIVTLAFSESLAALSAAPQYGLRQSFAVHGAYHQGIPVGVISPNEVAVSGATVTLTLGSGVPIGKEATVSYIPEGSGDGQRLRYAGGDKLGSFTVTAARPAADPPPVPVAARVEGAKLTLTFDRALDESWAPAGSRFRVQSSAPIPTAGVLVSNIGKSVDPSRGHLLRNTTAAQGFTTGSSTVTLTSVDVKFSIAPGSDLRVRVLQDTHTGTEVATLTNPSTLAAGNLTFTAPAIKVLAANTTYYVVVDSTNTGTLSMTADHGEDTGGEPGWSIENGSYERGHGSWAWLAVNTALIRVNGTGAGTGTSTQVQGMGTATVNGNHVTVPLASAVPVGHTPRVYYDPPGDDANPLRGASSGSPVEYINGIWANVAAASAPALDSAVVAGTKVTLYYNEALDTGSVPATSAFTVTAAGSGVTVSSVAVSETAVTLTLASSVAASSAVTVSYTAPGTNPVRDLAGANAGNLSNEAMTNLGPTDTGAPAVASAKVYTAGVGDGSADQSSVLTLTFDKELDPASVPAASAFTFSHVWFSAESVVVRGKKVELGLPEKLYPCTDSFTVSYAKPASGGLRNLWDTEANDISGQAVTYGGTETCVPGFERPTIGSLILHGTRPFDTDYQPQPEWFTVKASSGPVTVTAAAFDPDDASRLVLSLSRDFVAGETISFSYRRPRGHPGLWNIDGNQIADVIDMPVVNTVGHPPTVNAVSITSDPGDDDTYAMGETVRVRLTFSKAMDVATTGGRPRLKIDMDPADWGEQWAVYESGSATNELVFFHPVVEPNLSTRGIAVLADTLELNGGAIVSASSQTDADLSHDGLDHDPDHKVDWQLPPPQSPPGGANRAPMFVGDAPGSMNAPSATLVSLVASKADFRDPDGDALTFSLSTVRDDVHVPGDLLYSDATQRIFFKANTECALASLDPPLPQTYESVVTMTATDPDGATGSVTATFRTTREDFGCPSLSTATVDGATVTLEFDGDLGWSYDWPAADQFVLKADGAAVSLADARPVTTGDTITLTLAAPVHAGQTVTVSYVPGDSPVAVAFADQPAVNNTPAPAVTAVATVSDPGADDTYAKDDVIRIRVTFDEAVDVDTSGGTPRLKLKMDPNYGEKWASYASGSGATALIFTFTVVEPNYSSQGIAVLANTLELNGGDIESVNTDADANLSHTGLAHDSGHKVDWEQQEQSQNSPATGAPAITGTARVGETLTADTSGISDSDGITGATFSYQWVAAGADISGATGSTYTLASADQGKAVRVRVSFTDDAGHSETLTSAATAAVAAATPPAVTAVAIVSDPGDDDTYAKDDVIQVRVTFDEAVDVDTSGGTPRLKIKMDPNYGDKWASYASGGGSTALIFTFTVVEPNYSSQGIAVLADTLELNGGGIESANTDADANLSHSGLAHDSGHKVDWQQQQQSQNSPATGAPAITGTARVGETLTADTTGISDSDGLTGATFSYQWVAADADISGATGSAYTLASGDQGKTVKVRVSFTDDAGHAETLTSTATAAVAAATPPAVTAVAIVSDPGDDDTYARDDVIRIRVTFDEAVDVDRSGGTPRLKIKMDPSYGEKWAGYASGGGSTALIFTFTVVEPNFSPQGIAVLANTLELNGGDIESASTDTDADLSHTGLAHDSNHKVDWQQ